MSVVTPDLPTARVIQVDTRGALILEEQSPDTKDSRGIYLPNYIEPISHIAIDVGGSLAKVVYFTRSPQPPSSSSPPPSLSLSGNGDTMLQPTDQRDGSVSPSPARNRTNGALTPAILQNTKSNVHPDLDRRVKAELMRRNSVRNFPGGSLNFEVFETDNLQDCVDFIQDLIERSAHVNRVTVEEMKKGVQIIGTGGGAHKFKEVFEETLGMKIEREDEMDCLITGLKFITHIPKEVYYFSDELIHAVTHREGKHNPSESTSAPEPLERPSPNPPKYSVTFEDGLEPQLPCLLVNIGSGVSIIKIDEDGSFERVSGTSLGGGTLWGLLSMLTGASSFDEMLELSETGDNETVDMLVGDIYGQDYSRLGLKNTMIASSFGKVFRKGGVERKKFSSEDISKSLLYAISNNIGQIAYMNAEKYNIDKIYFGGFFIRGHAATIATLSYAIRFWSKGAKRAVFLRHEGFLGAIGAWIKKIEVAEEQTRLDGHEDTSSTE